jgi:hypothetical protein
MKKLSRPFFFFILILFPIINNVSAQTITGRIFNKKNGNPVGFVNVIAVNSRDTSLWAGTATDENGKFVLDISNNENYKTGDSLIVSVSYVGFSKKTATIPYALNKDSDLGKIYIEPASETLGEVVIKAKPFEYIPGGIKANIQNTVLSKLGSAIDVLAKTPFVIQKDNKIKVFGKGTPEIYVNNRLVQNNLELRQINSAKIKYIKVILSPGAEYGSNIKSVIKITTQKPKGKGLGGSISAETTVGRKLSHDEKIALNYNTKGLDIFGNFSYSDLRNKEYEDISHSFNFNSSDTKITDRTTQTQKGKRILAKLGFNKKISGHGYAGMRYIFSDLFSDKTGTDGSFLPTINGIPSDTVNYSKHNNDKPKYNYINAYYDGRLSEKVSAKLDLDYFNGIFHNSTSLFHNPTEREDFSANGRNNNNMFAGKLKINITTGGKSHVYFGGEYANTNNKEKYSVGRSSIDNTIESSKYNAGQNLYALFTSYGITDKAFSAEAGLRYEITDFDYKNNGVHDTENSKTYSGLFPTVTLSYNGQTVQTSLSYKSSVKRPSYSLLSNSTNIENYYIYKTGNPYLRSTRENEFTYTFMWGSFYAMASYAFLHHQMITNYSQYGEENIIEKHPVNINDSRRLTAECGYSIEAGIWESDIELFMQKQYLKAGTPEMKFDKPIFGGSIENYFQFSRYLILTLDLNGNTSGNDGISYLYDSYTINCGIIKSFMKGNLRLRLSANDIFQTDRSKYRTTINNIHIGELDKPDSRNITFSVTFMFNHKKSKYKGEKASNELDRVIK